MATDSEKSKTPETDRDYNEDIKKPKIWGLFYLVLGIAGLLFSVFSIIHNLDKPVPLYGTVIVGVLIGAISHFL